MKAWFSLKTSRSPGRGAFAFAAAVLIVLWLGAPQRTFPQSGQQRKKFPGAEKVVDNYLKALGGKKKLSAIRDASLEWTLQLNEYPIGKATTQIKSPASRRAEMHFGNGQIISGASPASAWVQGLDKRLLTLTGAEAAAAKLEALLEASHLIDFKKSNVMGRVVSLGDLTSEPAYSWVFQSCRRPLRYWFSTRTNLLTRVEDEARKLTLGLADYKASASRPGLLQAHQLTLKTGDGELTYKLERASYNTNLPNSAFDPPARDQALDVVGLLRAVAQNQDVVEKRVTEYAYLQKETDRELNDKGELKKEKTRVYEVFPLAHREPIQKLISEDGVALSGERAAKETKRSRKSLKSRAQPGETEEKFKLVGPRESESKRKKDADESEDPEISHF